MARREQPFGRQLFGYRREAVDQHLVEVDRAIGELNEKIAALTKTDDDDLVLRATRRAVDDVLQRAHAEAERVRSDAEKAAAQLLADAYEIAAARDTSREERATDGSEWSVIDLPNAPDTDDATDTEVVADEAPGDPTPEFTESVARAIEE